MASGCCTLFDLVTGIREATSWWSPHTLFHSGVSLGASRIIIAKVPLPYCKFRVAGKLRGRNGMISLDIHL